MKIKSLPQKQNKLVQQGIMKNNISIFIPQEQEQLSQWILNVKVISY